MKNSETNDTAAVSEQGASGAPGKPSSKKGATRRKAAPKCQPAVKDAKLQKETSRGKKAPKTAAQNVAPRPESKGAKILEMLRRAKGATLAELMKATDWQAHSVRGFISTAAKKHDITIESSKTDAGDRSYRIAK
jgi:hypothetical protein